MIIIPTINLTMAVTVAVLYAVGGGLCLYSALWPMNPEAPIGLLRALAALGLVGGAALWLLRDRLRSWVVHAAVVLVSILIALLAWQSATAVGIVTLGPALIAVAGLQVGQRLRQRFGHHRPAEVGALAARHTFHLGPKR